MRANGKAATKPYGILSYGARFLPNAEKLIVSKLDNHRAISARFQTNQRIACEAEGGWGHASGFFCRNPNMDVRIGKSLGAGHGWPARMRRAMLPSAF